MRSAPVRLAGAGAILVLALGATACGATNSGKKTQAGSTGGSNSGSKACKIALLLPETKTTRYEAHDKPEFEAKVKSIDSSCTVDYFNANQDATQQQNQANTAITNGDGVLVLDAVDGKAAATIVNQAKAKNIPVLAYDRLASGPVTYYISFDNEKVGELQGQALVEAMKAAGAKAGDGIIMINGSPTDPNAGSFKKGAHSAIDSSGFKVLKEYDTPDWSPNKAHDEAAQALTAAGKNNVKGVYVANDGMAGGVIAALQSAGVSPLPPVTGQDAQLDGIQRILAGQQYMTIYKAIKPEAEQAATVAVQLAKGQQVQGQTTVTNDSGDSVQATLLPPVQVTKDNVKSTVVADGFWSVSDICTAQYKDACSKAGLS